MANFNNTRKVSQAQLHYYNKILNTKRKFNFSFNKKYSLVLISVGPNTNFTRFSSYKLSTWRIFSLSTNSSNFPSAAVAACFRQASWRERTKPPEERKTSISSATKLLCTFVPKMSLKWTPVTLSLMIRNTLILFESVRNMASLSIPRPHPPVGGRPYLEKWNVSFWKTEGPL